MLILAVLSGFVLAIVAPLLHRLTREVTGWVLAALPFSLTLYFAALGLRVAGGEAIRESVRWVPSLGIDMAFSLDGLSLLFVLVISGIGALVLVFSGGYLHDHPELPSFYSYILAFMASMLGLVLSDDILTMFVFWELTSMSSYLLIGFKHDEEESRTAALQALLVTSLGGLSLLAGGLLLTDAGGATRLSDLLQRGALVKADPLYLPILLLISGAAFTKSAQFPFHFWLPSAMQAPTPVSAYLHSATMVKAGVYLLARLSPVLGGTAAWFYLVGAVGAASMVLGAYLALRHTDLKLILAYSTVSVLGLLTMLLGIGTEEAMSAAVTYLLAHALYKGALFLAAGSIDHEAGSRDVTELSGLRRAMPVTALAAGLAALSMAGVAPLAGFLGKEMLYEAAQHAPSARLWTSLSVLASTMLVAAALMAGLKPFFGGPLKSAKEVHEAPVSLWIGPLILAGIGAAVGIVGGAGRYLLSPAASAIAQRAVEVDDSLWHGLTPTLALSVLSLAAGVAIFAWRPALDALAGLAAPLEKRGPNVWYFKALDGLNALASLQTRVVQSGYLRSYILATVTTALVLAAYPLWTRVGPGWPVSFAGLQPYELALAILILVGALAALHAHSMMASVAALGVVGFSVALVFVLFGAPDLAMTQFLVETLIVILFVLVVHRLPHDYSDPGSRAARFRDGVLCISVGALMTALVLAAARIPFDPVVSEYYASNSVPGGHGRNIVNVILVDFRSLDTLGEITVLAVAALGVYAILRLRLSAGEKAR